VKGKSILTKGMKNAAKLVIAMAILCLIEMNTSADVSCGSDICTPPSYKANGVNCTFPAECGYGHCVDGVCCDIACDGTCQRCAGSSPSWVGTNGTCATIPATQDPDSECDTVSCSNYFWGWDTLTCYNRADVSAANSKCSGSNYCYTAGDYCPTQAKGDSSGVICDCSPEENGCSGVTAGTCGNSCFSYGVNQTTAVLGSTIEAVSINGVFSPADKTWLMYGVGAPTSVGPVVNVANYTGVACSGTGLNTNVSWAGGVWYDTGSVCSCPPPVTNPGDPPTIVSCWIGGDYCKGITETQNYLWHTSTCKNGEYCISNVCCPSCVDGCTVCDSSGTTHFPWPSTGLQPITYSTKGCINHTGETRCTEGTIDVRFYTTTTTLYAPPFSFDNTENITSNIPARPCFDHLRHLEILRSILCSYESSFGGERT
jgi:hypothetical protein